jgi:transcriptional regulator with XRE-family HTH domain
MSKQTESTFDKMMKKPSFKKKFEEGYSKFLLSELICALMEQDDKSVRQLAAELGVSKTVIRNLRSGSQSDVKISNFLKLITAYGYHLILEKGKDRIEVPVEALIMEQRKTNHTRTKKV